MNESPDHCQQRLRHRAERDGFLGQADQRPELDQQVSDLAAGLARHEQKPRARFAELLERLRTAIEEANKALHDCRVRQAENFSRLHATATDTDVRERASRSLDDDLNRLNRRILPRAMLALNAAHPRHKLWPVIVEELHRFHRESVEALPEILVLRFARGTAPLHAGNTLAATECEARLSVICRSRWLAGWRFWLMRAGLRRRYRHSPIPLREMAQEWLIENTSVDLDAVNARHESTHTALEQRLRDALRRLRFNLETAAAEIAEPHRPADAGSPARLAGELEGLVLGALDAMAEALDEIVVVYSSVFEGMMADIVEEHHRDLVTIRRAIDDAGTWHGRWRWNRRRASKSLQRGRARFMDRYGDMASSASRAWNDAKRRIGHRLADWRERLGFAEVAEEERLLLTDLPSMSEVRQQAESLPPLYRRLFSTSPLISREFLVGLDAELKALNDAVARWKDGLPANVAIIGPEGSGKTSLLNCLDDELIGDIPVRRFVLNERLATTDDVIHTVAKIFELDKTPASVPDLVETLRALPRQIVMLEHGHLIYLRSVGAREAPETFFHVMMRTREHILWLTAFRLYPWQRLEYLFDAPNYYTHVLKTRFQQKADLREAIERRQRSSGLSLTYSDKGLRTRRIEKLRHEHAVESPAMQEALADEFFSALFRATGGNMIAAIFYWLNAVRPDKNDRLVIQPCLELDDRFITDLDRPYHFTLAEVLGHGGLSPEEHACIFRQTPEQSRLMLGYLRELRLLEGRERDELGQRRYYVMNPVFHHPVSQALANLNILH